MASSDSHREDILREDEPPSSWSSEDEETGLLQQPHQSLEVKKKRNLSHFPT